MLSCFWLAVSALSTSLNYDTVSRTSAAPCNFTVSHQQRNQVAAQPSLQIGHQEAAGVQVISQAMPSYSSTGSHAPAAPVPSAWPTGPHRHPGFQADPSRRLQTLSNQSAPQLIIAQRKINAGWEQWSWGTQIPPFDQDADAAGAMCFRIDQFGAVSLKAPGGSSFAVAAWQLQLEIFSITSSGDGVGKLFLQLESTAGSTGSDHHVLGSASLTSLGLSHDPSALRHAVTIAASDLVTASDGGQPTDSFDRINLGRCLSMQRGADANGAAQLDAANEPACADESNSPPLHLCITRLSLTEK